MAQIFECPRSGLRFRTPASAEEIAEFYQSEYHDRMVGSEDDGRTDAYEQENAARIAHLSQFKRAGKVLDVGCSTGLFASQLKAAGFDAYGADISEYACSKAAELLGEDHVFNEPVEELAKRFPATFDAITMMDVIEHFADVITPLQAMLNMLLPGGVLFLRTPTLSSPFYRVADLSYRLSLGRYKSAVLRIYHAEHFFFFNEDNIRTLLEDVGYEVLAVDADPLLWSNFRSAEMRHGVVTNAVLGGVYWLGRALGRGHGMKVVARRPVNEAASAAG